MPNFTHKPLFIFLMLLTACNSKEERNKASLITKPDTLKVLKPDTIKVMSLQVGDTDTSVYNNLPYYDTSMGHQYGNGYKDTFSVGGTNFRLIHNDNLFDGILEKFEKGHWVVQWLAEVLGNHNDYDRTHDLNGDGYNDFIFYWNWWGEVYLFNTATKKYPDSSDIKIGTDWYLFDKEKTMYYEVYFGKLMDPVESNLFSFKGSKRLEIKKLTLKFDRMDAKYIINEGSLTDSSGAIITTNVVPKKKTSVEDFDFKAFWKKHY